MNRRNFLKGCLQTSVASLVPIKTGEKLGMSRLTQLEERLHLSNEHVAELEDEAQSLAESSDFWWRKYARAQATIEILRGELENRDGRDMGMLQL